MSTPDVHSQQAVDKAVADAIARCVRIAEMHSITAFDARSLGYMDAVNRIVTALKEQGMGKFQRLDGTFVEGSILDGAQTGKVAGTATDPEEGYTPVAHPQPCYCKLCVA